MQFSGSSPILMTRFKINRKKTKNVFVDYVQLLCIFPRYLEKNTIMNRKLISLIPALLFAFGQIGLTQTSAGEAPEVGFKLQPTGLQISIGGAPFASYFTPTKRIPRPYFANVKTPSGIQVTRNHPPIEGKDSMDHDTYHPGIWMTYAGINGNDYWRLKKRVEHERYLGKPEGGAGKGSFTVSNFFLDSEDSSGRRIAQEITKYTIVARGDYTLLISETEIFSDASDIVFGDDQEYGLGIRVQTMIEERYNGQIVNAEGRKGEEGTYGRSTPWCDYSGVLDGKFIGINVMTDPLNFRPSWFHSRDYGLIAANPFGREKVGGGTESNLLVKKGEKLALGFGLAIYSGDSEANIDRDAMYQDYLSVIRGE